MHITRLIKALAVSSLLVGSSLADLASELPAPTQTHGLVEARQTPSDTATSTAWISLPPDHWRCIEEDIPQWFSDVPRPTGNVVEAIGQYGDYMCADSSIFFCTISRPQDWCGFTTWASSHIMSSYSTYLSQVVSFCTEHSSTLSVLSTSCPVAWGRLDLGTHEWLKIASAHAGCYLGVYSQTVPSETGSSSGRPLETTEEETSSTPASRTTAVTSTGAANEQPTSTGEEAGACRSRGLGILALMGTGLALITSVVNTA